MTKDTELLRRYAEERSETAFAELVQRHIGLVYNAALRQLGGAVHRAKEVTQSVFIDLARKAPALSQHAELAGWLYTSTHYAAAKLKRTEQRRQRREEEASAMHEITSAHGDAANWDQLRPVLDEVMHELPAPDRTVILSRFFQGRRYSEVGDELGLTEDAARMHVERALDKLRVLLARRRITSTTSALTLALAHPPIVAVPAALTASVTGAALASGTGAAAGATALFLMKMKPFGTALGLTVAAGVGLYGLHEARSARAENTHLAAERTSLLAQVRDLEQRLTAAEQARLELQRQASPARSIRDTTAFALPTPARPAQTTTTTDGAQWSFRALTPAEARERNTLNIDTTYAALYRQLDWTPEQREQFRTVMLERQESGSQLFKAALAAARQTNPALDRAGMFEVFEATNAQLHVEQQADVRRLFGDAAAQALAHYQATLSMRTVANQLASALFNSPSPLAPAQADQLVDLLARHARGPIGKVEVSALDTAAAVAEAQAQGLLSAPQAAELRRIAAQAQEKARREREANTGEAASVQAPRN